MKNNDIRQSQREVEENTQRVENALNQFSARINEGTDMFTERVNELTDSVKRPQQTIEQYVNEAKVQADSFIHKARSQAENIVGDIQKTAEQGLHFMEERPLGTWMTVFFAGYLLGIYAMKSRESRKISRPDLRPELREVPKIA